MKILKARGSLNSNGSWDINTTEILTCLIKESAKCKSYSSDLFIDWEKINTFLINGETDNIEYLFGFRELGVDHKEFILLRGLDYYRAIYKLSIDINNHDEITMTLEKLKKLDIYKKEFIL